jgi:hypothetical protein
MKALLLSFGLWLASAPFLAAQDLIDRIDESLTISSYHDQARARLSGLLDLEYYHFAQPPPGLIRADGHDLFAPRLTAFLDAQLGPHVYFFAQSRVDTGFDPSDLGAQLRLDEFALRITPWSDGRFNVQVGRFATIFGAWVERHLSWDNPFVNAPLPYETATLVSDWQLPLTGQSFRAVPGSEKYEFLPVVWGPSYAQGISVSGELGMFQYAAEVKNAPVSSRPETWDEYDFSRPATDLRFGLQPNEAWHFGLSAGEGPYLNAEAPLPHDEGGIDDYRQFVLGQDISYARGHWQIWLEVIESRFEVPRVGDADVFAYYVETKYQITPQLFGALRWNQQMFQNERDSVAKAHDIWRAEVALGYRFSAHTQWKIQYSLIGGDFVSERTSSFFATQFTVRF